ncbi:MAG TPA: hypothetical protein VFA96_06555, partial [Nocardioides sp.]|nr:hypothetical protein [Nocardioides sp.]
MLDVAQARPWLPRRDQLLEGGQRGPRSAGDAGRHPISQAERDPPWVDREDLPAAAGEQQRV